MPSTRFTANALAALAAACLGFAPGLQAATADQSKPSPSPAAAPAPAPAATPAAEDALAYSGISLFRTYCSVCHGKDARGDGPMADQLRYRPPDLTAIAKRNEGHFSVDKVQRMIDGRDPVKGHGGPDMPVWGDAFKNAREGYGEREVKAKLRAITEYLEGIQER